jgi:hypothetical protein
MNQLSTQYENFFRIVVSGGHLRKFSRVVRLGRQNGLLQLLRLFCICTLAPIPARLMPFLTRLHWQIRIYFQELCIDRDLRRLERRKSEIIAQGLNGYRLPVAQLKWFSQLNVIQGVNCGRFMVLGSFDQDGYLYSPAGPIGDIPWISEDRFLPRKRFLLDLVVLNGLLAIRKNYRGKKVHFVREIMTLDRLARAGCNVPAILHIDFDKLTLFLSFIPGKVLREEVAKRGAKIQDRDVEDKPNLTRREARAQGLWRIEEGRRRLSEVIDSNFIKDCFRQIRLAHRAGVTSLDIKYGNVIIEETSKTPFLIDFDNVLIFENQENRIFRNYRDHDIKAFNLHFGTQYLHRKELQSQIKERSFSAAKRWYAPVYIRDGLHIGRLWDVNSGFGRWHFILKNNFPPIQNRRVLDLGANNGFNALQMLREGAREVVAIEISEGYIQQGHFLKDAFEWADNREYNLRYYQCDMREIPRLDLGTFDFAIALCSLYYLPKNYIPKLIRHVSEITHTFVLQCNIERDIGRRDPETYDKAAVEFTVYALVANGFPRTQVIAPKGYTRPLVIGYR